jgi:hypothetical protein
MLDACTGKSYNVYKMWSNDSNMKKKIIILILSAISILVAVNLFFASRLSQLSDLDLFDIEEDD